MRVKNSAVVDGHVMSVTVTDSPGGWNVRHERDSIVIRTIVRDDWHRVERDLRLFRLRAEALPVEAEPFALCPA